MIPRRNIPYVVLAGALLLTAIATAFLVITVRARDRARFENAVQSAEADVVARLDTYIALLHGTAGLFLTADRVSHPEFRRYVEHLDVRRRYPGIQGIGYTARVHPESRDSLVRSMRTEGFPDFRLWPDTPRTEVHAIVYLEPLDRRNRAAIGYDMFTEATRRAAMIRARDEARPAMSGRVTLVQEIDVNKQAGFLIYLPLYRNGDIPAAIDQRREALVGYVYAPFRAGDLFQGIFGAYERPRVTFRVYDGPTPDSTALLFDSRIGDERATAHDPAMVETRQITVAGRPWTIVFGSTAYFENLLPRGLTASVAIAGLLVSLLLFWLSRSQTIARGTAERSEAVRSRFFAAMSHELRTPINAILGYNDLLLTGIYGPLSDGQRDGVERSQKAARHLAELVNDVLDLSKIEAGKLDIVVEPVQVPALLDELTTTIRPMAEERGSELAVQCAGGIATIESDPRRIRQILLNLLSNAVKYGLGRPITVRCSPAPDGGVMVEVIDQGRGIAPEDLPRIFEEFVQLPTAFGGTREGGTGLGLTISRRLATLLGGYLEVSSTLGVGSTFRLVLPPKSEPHAAEASGESGRAAASRR